MMDVSPASVTSMAQRTSCAIHFLGSVHAKKEAKGLKCDTCRENFNGLASSACKACDCNLTGSQVGTICDAETGQCICKSNAGGRQCNQCVEGSFSLPQKDSFLLLPCNCEKTGTVDSSLSRDKSTGPCPSKAVVTPVTTATSVSLTGSIWRWAIFKGARCERDSLGTIPGSICDPISGQCLCRPHWRGRRCEQCQPGRRPAPFQCSDYRGPLCFWVQLLESVPPAASLCVQPPNRAVWPAWDCLVCAIAVCGGVGATSRPKHFLPSHGCIFKKLKDKRLRIGVIFFLKKKGIWPNYPYNYQISKWWTKFLNEVDWKDIMQKRDVYSAIIRTHPELFLNVVI